MRLILVLVSLVYLGATTPNNRPPSPVGLKLPVVFADGYDYPLRPVHTGTNIYPDPVNPHRGDPENSPPPVDGPAPDDPEVYQPYPVLDVRKINLEDLHSGRPGYVYLSKEDPSDEKRKGEVQKIARGLRAFKNAVLALQEPASTTAQRERQDEEPSIYSPEAVKARVESVLRKLAQLLKRGQQSETAGDEEEEAPGIKDVQTVDDEEGEEAVVEDYEDTDREGGLVVNYDKAAGAYRFAKIIRWMQSLPKLESGADPRERVDPKTIKIMLRTLFDYAHKIHRIKEDAASMEEDVEGIFEKLYYIFHVNRVMDIHEFVKILSEHPETF